MQPTMDQGSGASSFFWMAFEKSSNAMVLLGDGRRIVDVNDAALRLIGYDRDEMVGAGWDRFVAPQSWRRLESDWRIVQREGEITSTRQLIRADGRRVDVQFAARQEILTGRKLVLYVVLEQHLRPVTCSNSGECLAMPTRRELEVISRIAMGYRVHEIAAELFISPATVQTHVRKAMMKLGTRSQAQLVARAIATGLLDPAVAQAPALAASA
jgi:PAS domain S-box-containing protein